jgi:hypothetical protein
MTSLEVGNDETILGEVAQAGEVYPSCDPADLVLRPSSDQAQGKTQDR